MLLQKFSPRLDIAFFVFMYFISECTKLFGLSLVEQIWSTGLKFLTEYTLKVIAFYTEHEI